MHRINFMNVRWLSLTLALASPALAKDDVDFNRDIRPILADACFHCHGPDPDSRKADVRLDTAAGVFEGDAPVIDRENLADSELLYRITTKEADEVMPPPENHRQLEPREVELLKRWVEEGAEWQSHWAFEKPEKPDPPQVQNESWPRNDLDRFVLARLESAGLKPAREADPRTLVRRLALDLTGLPPEPHLVEAFANDPNDEAWEALIDSMLESPAYGEHRARYWLDAARYGDTHGLHFDNYREMWPYRDWVVQAFNRNQPFDEFTIEQLAGDLLENPSREQLIATGFQRCNITTNEGGTIVEENLANYAADRVQTLGWVYMGLTTNCAQCHDHKFDPITTKDYYAMAAFFRNTTQGGLDGNVKDGRGPAMTVPSDKDVARWDALPNEIAEAKKRRDAYKANAEEPFRKWLQTFTLESLDNLLPSEALEFHQSETVTVKEGNIQSFKDAGNVQNAKPFTVSLWVKPKNVRQNASAVARMGVANDYRGWDVWQEGKRLGMHLINKWPAHAIKVMSKGEILKPNQWTHITLIWDGSSKAKGIRLAVDGVDQPLDVKNDSLKPEQSVETNVPLSIGSRSQGSAWRGEVKDVRFYNTNLDGKAIVALAQVDALRKALASPEEKPSDQLLTFYLQTEDKTYGELQATLSGLEKEREAIRNRSPITHIQKEKEGSAMANILMRGQYDKVGEEVAANTPEAFFPMPEDAPRNRLGLAQWLVSPENPLTSRVTVNRFWQEIFGHGLVVTTEDIGIMGALPSHPQLLDWLAVTFQENGWDVKQLFKTIFMSATYRQAARTTAEKLEKDPHNALLSRGPRFRMDAEMVRDYALAVSGTLSPKMGGPSTRPYQPEGIWDVVGLPGGDTRNYVQDKGEGLYRRTLYNFWKRMAPPPNLEAFNAPSREVCTVRRERTNTPLQALVTLNDPQFVEAARRLAERALGKSEDDRQVLDYLFRRVLLRPLRNEERVILQNSLTDLLAFYREHQDEAKALIAVGDSAASKDLAPSRLAAWTMLTNQVLNLDETLNK